MSLLPNTLLLVPLAYLVYSTGTVIYRLYFHPLSKFPGPKIAAATSWYETYHDLKRPGGQLMYKIRELHGIYGPVVRISPEEIHILDSKWIDNLFAGPTQGRRDKYVPAAHAAGTPKGAFGTPSHDVHRHRRAALNPLFSKAMALGAESMIYDNCNLLLRQIDRQITRDGFSDLRKAFQAFATDVVSTYISGSPSGLLKDEVKINEWHEALKALTVTIPVGRQFNWIIPLSMAFPTWLMKKLAPKMAMVIGMHYVREPEALMAIREHENREQGTKLSDYRPAPLEHLALYKTLLSNSALPPSEKHYQRMSHEAVTIIAAGGETTASALMTAVYFVYTERDTILPTLKHELQSVLESGNSRPSIAELERLPYLTAVIKETLRITTIPGRLTRVAPDATLTYGDWAMPPGTPISMSLRDVSLDPEIFPEPMKFDPERWLPSNPNLNLCNRYLVPFSRGTRTCVGMNLAYAEMYIVMAAMLRRLDFELYDTIRERDVDFVRDLFVGGTSAEARGVRVRYATSPA